MRDLLNVELLEKSGFECVLSREDGTGSEIWSQRSGNTLANVYLRGGTAALAFIDANTPTKAWKVGTYSKAPVIERALVDFGVIDAAGNAALALCEQVTMSDPGDNPFANQF